jgi:hypothetical protein
MAAGLAWSTGKMAYGPQWASHFPDIASVAGTYAARAKGATFAALHRRDGCRGISPDAARGDVAPGSGR